MKKTDILKRIILENRPKTLVAARNVDLTVPVFTPQEQSVSVNPARIITNFYHGRAKYQKKKILDNVTFDVLVGERIGILGRNGAGKTTLLRIVAGIIKNTGGDLIVNGEARGLFNVSFGMDENATGLENIYLRGLQMGLKIGQLRELIPEVVEFTELGESIHQVFGTYSTGMRLRLAVAISTMIAPKILLMDEWIGSGDAIFRQKVRKRMQKVLNDSEAMILASHNLPLLKEHCNKGWVMDGGRLVYCGELKDAIEFYQNNIG